MKTMPDESIDCIITSPPYYGLRNYGEGLETVWGGVADCKHEFGKEIRLKTSDNYNNGFNERCGNSPGQKKQEHTRGYKEISQGNFCIHCNAWRGQLGLEPTHQSYISHLEMIFAECKRVLKKSGTLWVNIGDTYCGSPVGSFNGGGKQFAGTITKNMRIAITYLS